MVVHALKLVELSIAKFLPPDLALLVEEDSTTSMLGSMLTAKLYDRHWEIRDSTLEILHTIANISNSSKSGLHLFVRILKKKKRVYFRISTIPNNVTQCKYYSNDCHNDHA